MEAAIEVDRAPPPTFERSNALLARAKRVIPNGVWGHNKFPAVYDDGKYPWFARSGRGSRFVDADGREYIDYICGYGAMVNGYANPEVDAAAKAVLDRGDCFPQTTETSIELAEVLTSMVWDMGWCAFGKSGSDAIATAILVARAATGRSGILCFEGAYHGSHFWSNWSNPGAGRPLGDSADIVRVPWNSIAALEAALAAGRGAIGALIATPFHHPIPGPSILPDAEFWPAAQRLCQASGVLLIVDDVRTGFRLDLAGSHAHYGVAADMVCLSKALGNTHPIAATLGRKALFDSAGDVFSAGTFWGASAPMAASLANLRILRESGAIARMNRLGTALWDGLVESGERHGFTVQMSGVLAIPSMNIAGDPQSHFVQAFAEEIVARGVFLNPLHNWFLSNAHSDEDIAETLDHADESFRAVRQALGTP